MSYTTDMNVLQKRAQTVVIVIGLVIFASRDYFWNQYL